MVIFLVSGDYTETSVAGPTGGVARAKSQALLQPPSASECKLPKRWIRIRGKLRCRRPKRRF